MPFYNEDLDGPGDVPGPAQALRDAVRRADALLLVTPEYNGSLPAVLKNAIDWTSRPHQAGAITGKPVAVAGASNGRYGGVWAHDDTRKTAGIAGTRLEEVARPCRVPPSGSPPSILSMTTKSPPPCSTYWPHWPQPPEPPFLRLRSRHAQRTQRTVGHRASTSTPIHPRRSNRRRRHHSGHHHPYRRVRPSRGPSLDFGGADDTDAHPDHSDYRGFSR